MWYFINALDVHSTRRGMKYSCIKEVNPLLPDIPGIDRLIIHKTIIMTWMQHPEWNPVPITKQDLRFGTFLIAVVAMNNYRITDEAAEYPDRCPLR